MATVFAPSALGNTDMEDLARLNLVGESSAFLRCVELIRRYAACDATVLIHGETGTGKELAARGIHYLGARRDFPFIPVNCGAIPDTLVENELFGHTLHPAPISPLDQEAAYPPLRISSGSPRSRWVTAWL
jgi:DNA-binding NtrC family response regulator